MATTTLTDPWRTVRIASGTLAATLALLAIKYPDRAIFDQHREGIATMKGLPLVGGLPRQIMNRDIAYDMLCRAFQDLDAVTMYVCRNEFDHLYYNVHTDTFATHKKTRTGSNIGLARRIITIHPDNVEHILKRNYIIYISKYNIIITLQVNEQMSICFYR